MSSSPGTREVAFRLFAAEFDDATLSYSESDEERAPNYVVTPTGARVNRLFVAGVLTEVERVNDDTLRARVVDPSGAFVTYAGQYQPDEQAFLDQASPPAFVALTGKARTFQPEDSDRVFTSLRPESVNEVDADTRDRWIVTAAETTLDRLAVVAKALDSELRGDDLRAALAAGGAPEPLAAGIPRALDHYDTSAAYVEAVRQLAVDALETVAGEREEVRAPELAPDEGGQVEIGPLPETDVALVPPEREDETGEAVAPAAAGDVTGTEAATADADAGDAEATAGSAAGSESGVDAETTAEPESAEEEAAAGDDLGDFDDDLDGDLDDDSADDPDDDPADVDDDPADVDDDTEDDLSDDLEDEPADVDDDTEDEPEDDLKDEPDDRADDEPVVDDSEPATAEDPVSGDATADDGPTADEEPAADAAASAGVDGEMYELDEAEREEIESEFDTSFSTGTEVDEPGEADIDVPDPEELAEDAGADPSADDAGTETAEGAAEEAAEDAGEAEDAEPDADVDLEDAVVDAMSELDDGDGAAREAVVDAVVEEHGADADDVADAIEDALMSGKCYEAGEGSLKAI